MDGEWSVKGIILIPCNEMVIQAKYMVIIEISW